MNRLAALSEDEIEERFCISGVRAIQFVLNSLIASQERLSVHITATGEQFLTIALAVDAQQLIIDCSGSETFNRRFLGSSSNLFLARPDGICLQFITGAARESQFANAPAFALPLPNRLIRRQRRDSFRIETPRVKPVRWHCTNAAGHLLKLAAHDVSVAGVGVLAASNCGLQAGDRLDRCQLYLPDDGQEALVLSASVRHVTPLEQGTPAKHWRIGLQFDEVHRADERRLQRYIAYREHQRKEWC